MFFSLLEVSGLKSPHICRVHQHLTGPSFNEQDKEMLCSSNSIDIRFCSLFIVQLSPEETESGNSFFLILNAVLEHFQIHLDFLASPTHSSKRKIKEALPCICFYKCLKVIDSIHILIMASADNEVSRHRNIHCMSMPGILALMF